MARGEVGVSQAKEDHLYTKISKWQWYNATSVLSQDHVKIL